MAKKSRRQRIRYFLKEISSRIEESEHPDPDKLRQAQEIVYDAWETDGPQRIELALQALTVCPDCADAYVLLAYEYAADLKEAKELYKMGVIVGKKALGPRAFEEDVGHFWGLIETRPYMRARVGVAECLWDLGERQQAIEHYYDMLHLNPNDNQGIRYLLLNCLMAEKDDKAAEELLKKYKGDIDATWYYSRALLTYRREGQSRRANDELTKALKQNPHVLDYLLGMKRLPKDLPDTSGIGDDREARWYVWYGLEAWQTTPGALEWLKENYDRMP
jgi:tetratricopeptide (TPR) repeat protein